MDTQAVISQIYAAFNKREIDGTLASMSEDASWPKASEGGRVVGNKQFVNIGRVSGLSSTRSENVLKVVNLASGVTDVNKRVGPNAGSFVLYRVRRGEERSARSV